MKPSLWMIGILMGCMFAAGRWSAPEKVRVEKQTVTVEREAIAQDAHIVTTTTESVKPDGSVSRVIQSVQDSRSKTLDLIASSQSEKQETTSQPSRWHLEALAGIHYGSPGWLYGASISKDILGPASLGLWGLSNASGGLSLGISL